MPIFNSHEEKRNKLFLPHNISLQNVPEINGGGGVKKLDTNIAEIYPLSIYQSIYLIIYLSCIESRIMAGFPIEFPNFLFSVQVY